MLLIFVLFILSLYWILSTKKVDKKTKPSNDYMNVIRQKHVEITSTTIPPPSVATFNHVTNVNNVNNVTTAFKTPNTSPGIFLTTPESPLIATAPSSPLGTPETPPGTPNNTVLDANSPLEMKESILMNDITVDKDTTTGNINIFTLGSDCLELDLNCLVSI